MTGPLQDVGRSSGGRQRWRRANLVVGLVLVGIVVVTAVVSFFWTPFDPEQVTVADRFFGVGEAGHWLGTDQLGRDIVSQLMVGSRNTLFVGVLAVGIAIVVGIPLGGLAAVRRGWVEELVMRLSDLMFAFPAVLLAILLVGALGPSTRSAMIAIGLAYVPIVARVTRGAALPVLERDFALAARSYGRGRAFIFVRHVLPNIASVLIVQATVLFALAILAEAALSFLGIGTQPPTPSWGRSLNDAQTFISVAPTLALWPGLAIALSVLGFNLLGDGLRDALDPRLEIGRT